MTTHRPTGTSVGRQLLPTQVRAIRRALANGETLSVLAHRYAIPACVVWSIREGRAYKDIPAVMTPRQHTAALNAVKNHNARYPERWPQFHRPLAEIEAAAYKPKRMAA